MLVSSVLFETAEIVPGLDLVAARCARRGATLLVDAYHHLNVVPFDVRSLGLAEAFVTGGGYKYCQLGEGNCFLRVPPGCQLRPVLTGWFSEFEARESTARLTRASAPERARPSTLRRAQGRPEQRRRDDKLRTSESKGSSAGAAPRDSRARPTTRCLITVLPRCSRFTSSTS